jgi:hypothetical protein
VAQPEVWCRITVVGPGGDELESWALSGPGRPDLAAVEVLARLHLESRRRGGHLIVQELCPALGELLELAGLGGLSREVGRQAEQREDRPGVEEAVEAADPPV